MKRSRCTILTLLLLAFFAVGCQSQPPMYRGIDGQPLAHYDDSPRSLALDSERLINLSQQTEMMDTWHLNRRDQGRVVYSGYVSPRVEYSSTYTRDTLTVHGDDIHDHYRQTTYRSSYRRSTR